jgi:hypothetical protein
MRTGTAKVYRCFTRTWWRYDENRHRVPGAGRQTTIARNMTEAEALDFCRVWNANHKPGPLSRKCEYTSD